MTRNYNTRHPFVTQRELVYHVAGGWWVGLVVGGSGGWFVCVVCVCMWSEVCGLWLVCGCGDFELWLWLIVLSGKHSQVESVAGAAHLPNDYAGVLR